MTLDSFRWKKLTISKIKKGTAAAAADAAEQEVEKDDDGATATAVSAIAWAPAGMRLKELNKRVIGCGTRGSTSRLIADMCDEFTFYDTLRKESRRSAFRADQDESPAQREPKRRDTCPASSGTNGHRHAVT